MCYVRAPRAQYIKANENIGILRANYWIIDDEILANKLVALLNSSKFMDMVSELLQIRHGQNNNINSGFLRQIDFKKL